MRSAATIGHSPAGLEAAAQSGELLPERDLVGRFLDFVSQVFRRDRD